MSLKNIVEIKIFLRKNGLTIEQNLSYNYIAFRRNRIFGKLGIGKDFLKATENREHKITDKLDIIKINNFCSSKVIIKRKKRQATD